MRARMALLLSGMKVELREVVLRDRPEHMLKISPKGTVPVLLLQDGRVLEESLDIMLWSLDDTYLVGDWEKLVDGNDGDFKYHLDRYKYNNRYDNPLSPEEHRAYVVEFLEMSTNVSLKQIIYVGQSVQSQTMHSLRLFVSLQIRTDRGLIIFLCHTCIIGCQACSKVKFSRIPW